MTHKLSISYSFPIRTLSLALFLACLLASFKAVAQVPRTYIYKTVDTVALSLDVYIPKGQVSKSQNPAIVFFFGGGWVGGNRAHFQPQAEFFSKRGLVCITVSYRIRSLHGTSPIEAIQDARDAMRWVRAHAYELQVDPNKLIASGGSAGGHLALATALIPYFDSATSPPTTSPIPNALILFNPVVNTTSRGYGVEKVGKDSLLTSPYHQIVKGVPPTLIFHGTSDQVVPYQNVLDFQARMRAMGNYCYVSSFEGKTHGFFNKNRGDGLDYLKTLVRSDKFIRLLGYL
ncbi:MAG: alpha/beta hydrolase [Bacteroidota bacterium]